MGTDQDRKQLAERMLMQSLATCNNYYYTGQFHKALSVLNKLKTMFPGHDMVDVLLAAVCRSAFENQVGDFGVLDFSPSDNGLTEVFGKNWQGESLDGQIITIFCDQGMGDTIQLMRYVREMDRKWDCVIYMNCYAYHEEMFDLANNFMPLTLFLKEHSNTNYHTNVMSIPSIMNGLEYECHYPAHFRDLLETNIPNDPYIFVDGYGKTKAKSVGLAWKSNSKNPLSEKKSIDPELFRPLTENLMMYNLLPEQNGFLFGAPMKNMMDTAKNIDDMDLVISVDTAVLHLAGAMGKPVWGLLPYGADPRWGDGDATPWYPTMKLYRQTEPDNWEEVIERVAKDLGEWRNQEC